MRMKSVLAISFLAASTSYGVVAQADTTTNFLAGFEGVYARQKENFSSVFNDPSLTPVALTVTNEQEYMLSDELLMMGGILGWQWRCNKILLGVEGNMDVHSLTKARSFVYNAESSVFEGTAKYYRGPIYGFTARAGYAVSPSMMPYIRAGAQFSRDEGTYQVFTNVNTVAQQADFVSSGKQDTWGYILGIGIEVPGMIGPATIRIEYVYSRSESLALADPIPPVFASNRFEHPQINAIKLAWVWNFVGCDNKTASVAHISNGTNTNGSSDDSSTSSSTDSSSSDAASTDSSKTASDAASTDSSKTASDAASTDSSKTASDASSTDSSKTASDASSTDSSKTASDAAAASSDNKGK